VTPVRLTAYTKPREAAATFRSRSSGLVGAARKTVSRPAPRATRDPAVRFLRRQVRDEDTVRARRDRIAGERVEPVAEQRVEIREEQQGQVAAGADAPHRLQHVHEPRARAQRAVARPAG
jgi:hypothetical protein